MPAKNFPSIMRYFFWAIQNSHTKGPVAMKMENALKAVADATVKKIMVKTGQAVEKNQVLIQLV